MNYFEFGELVFNNILLLVLITSCVLVVYFPIMKYKNFHIFALNLETFYNSMTCMIVFIFLLSINRIDHYYVKYYFLSEIFFLLGFCYKGKSLNSIIKENTKEKAELKSYDFYFYLFICFMYFAPTILIYKVKGIPILLDSRFETSLNGGGFGLFTRFTDFSSWLVIYFSFFIKKYSENKKYRFLAKINLGISVIILLLSGSRSALLHLFKILFIIYYSIQGYQPKEIVIYKKKTWNYIPLILISGLSLFFLRYKQQFIMQFLFRVICQGDSIFLAFPNQKIELLQSYSLGELLFTNLLVTFRLKPSSETVNVIGMELIKIVYGHYNDGGAVCIQNVEGYVHFREFGFIFSFFVGLVVNYITKRVYKLYKSKLLFIMNFSICYMAVCLSYNFGVAIGYVTTCLLNFPIYIVVYYLLKYAKMPKNVVCKI